MTITAKVIADSIGEHSPRLTTLQLRYPKFIHGELMTHRVFSRNASSSRAIPVERLIKDVADDPATPIHWGANQKGMQADKEHDARVKSWKWGGSEGTSWTNHEAWLFALDNAIHMARAFDAAGYHKQIVNRLIEPFCHINVVVTATEWSNFFALRRHPAAQPEMRALADAIYFAMIKSEPRLLRPTIDWHTPYADIELGQGIGTQLLIRLSVARCARTSYMTHDGRKPDTQEDLLLYDRLVTSVPLHASPAEHQATPDHPGPHKEEWSRPHLHGNFRGYVQYRKTLPGECQ